MPGRTTLRVQWAEFVAQYRQELSIRAPSEELRHPSQGVIVAFLISVALAFLLGVGCMYAYSTYTSDERDLNARIDRLNADLVEAKMQVQACEGINGRITNVITSIDTIRDQVSGAVSQLRRGADPDSLLSGLSASERAYSAATAELAAIQECNSAATTPE